MRLIRRAYYLVREAIYHRRSHGRWNHWECATWGPFPHSVHVVPENFRTFVEDWPAYIRVVPPQ